MLAGPWPSLSIHPCVNITDRTDRQTDGEGAVPGGIAVNGLSWRREMENGEILLDVQLLLNILMEKDDS